MKLELERVTASLLYAFLALVLIGAAATVLYVAAAPFGRVQESIALSYGMLRCVMSALAISSCGCLLGDLYIKMKCPKDGS